MQSQPAAEPISSSNTATTTPATTTTTTTTQPTPSRPAPAILRLRGVRSANGPSVHWAEGVVDNEGLGRKSSKVCCIYHPSRPVGDSSSESSSSDSSDSGSDDGGRGTDSDDSTAAAPRRRRRRHAHDCPRPAARRRAPSPNAYEKMPKHKPAHGGGPPPQQSSSSSSSSSAKTDKGDAVAPGVAANAAAAVSVPSTS